MGIAADFVLIVLAGLVGGLLARALRLPLLVGYVAAGIVIGPNTAGPTVVQVHDIELLAEIGVALLLFSLGLELSFRDLGPVRKAALIGGPIQVVLTCAVAALAAAQFLHLPVAESIWFGAMIAVSSTAVVLKTLSEAGVTSTLASRVMIGLLVIQDLAVVPMLVILPQLGDVSNLLGNLTRAIAIAAAILVAIVVLGTWLLPKLLRLVLGWGSRELFLVSVVGIGVGVGFATERSGLSFALGAFVAGLVLSESEFSHQALSDVVPLRDIFGLLFFVSVGMLLDPAYALANAGTIAAVVGLTIIGKALIFGGLTRAFGYVNMAPWIVGLGLSQIGEFTFVLARTGVTSGMLSQPTYNLVLTCTVLTMALSPLVSSLAPALARAFQRRRQGVPVAGWIELSETAPTGHVIVAGYGRSGRAAAKVLHRANVPFLIVEFNHGLFESIANDGYAAIWGDITSEAVLHAANIRSARVLILTLPDQATIHLTIDRARRLHPQIHTIARALRAAQVAELRRHHVDAVIQPEFEGGMEMVRQALLQYDDADSKTSGIIATARTEFYAQT